MTRLKIVHRTTYHYNAPVEVSYNEARMTPLSEPGQVVLASSLTAGSGPEILDGYTDYWGTQVTPFEMHLPHTRLEVVASSTVEVSRTVPTGVSLGWAELASPAVQNGMNDHLRQTRFSEPGSEVRDRVADYGTAAGPEVAAQSVFSLIRSEMQYMPGSTGVHTSALQAWNQRRGVCQDLAHLAIGCLRTLGIPARYVSGYLHPQADAEPGQTVAGQSHAWLEWWDGQWRSWDPTNHKPAGDFHVTVARGRDYRDVAPLKGILAGGNGSTLDVAVDMTWLTWDASPADTGPVRIRG